MSDVTNCEHAADVSVCLTCFKARAHALALEDSAMRERAEKAEARVVAMRESCAQLAENPPGRPSSIPGIWLIDAKALAAGIRALPLTTDTKEPAHG